MNKVFTFMRESLVARSLIPVGLILTIVGIVILVITIKNQNYIKIESTVSNVEVYEEAYTDDEGNFMNETYSVTVNYTVDERNYESKLDGINKYNVGDKMTIYYNPDDPSQITQTKSLILPIAFIVGGLGAFVGGIISGVNSYKRYKKMKEQEKGWENDK